MATDTTIIGYTVKNRITGKVTTFKTSAAATNAMNRIDNAYGACITSRQAIWNDPVATPTTK